MFVYIVYLVSLIPLRPWYFLLRQWTHTFTCGYHHNRIDGASMYAGTGDAEDDLVVNYFEYYD
jgi:hypothetical protein